MPNIAQVRSILANNEEIDHLNMSFDAEGRYGFFKASVKGEFADTTGYNSTSTFLVAKVIVSNPFLRGHDFTLTTAARAARSS